MVVAFDESFMLADSEDEEQRELVARRMRVADDGVLTEEDGAVEEVIDNYREMLIGGVNDCMADNRFEGGIALDQDFCEAEMPISREEAATVGMRVIHSEEGEFSLAQEDVAARIKVLEEVAKRYWESFFISRERAVNHWGHIADFSIFGQSDALEGFELEEIRIDENELALHPLHNFGELLPRNVVDSIRSILFAIYAGEVVVSDAGKIINLIRNRLELVIDRVAELIENRENQERVELANHNLTEAFLEPSVVVRGNISQETIRWWRKEDVIKRAELRSGGSHYKKRK